MKVRHIPKYSILPLLPLQTLEYFHLPTNSTVTPQMRPLEHFPLFNPPPMPRFPEICLLFLVPDFMRVVKEHDDQLRERTDFYRVEDPDTLNRQMDRILWTLSIQVQAIHPDLGDNPILLKFHILLVLPYSPGDLEYICSLGYFARLNEWKMQDFYLDQFPCSPLLSVVSSFSYCNGWWCR